jgi:hypothetical protein
MRNPASAQSSIKGNFSLNNAFRTIFMGVGGSQTLQGPNLYDLVMDANVTGGGTAGRLEKQGQGGLKLAGANSGLTGSNEVQTLTVPATISRFTINFGGFSSDVINFVDSNIVVQQKLEAMPSIGQGNVTVTSNSTTPGLRHRLNALGGYDVPRPPCRWSQRCQRVQRLTLPICREERLCPGNFDGVITYAL